jgi:malic enzyme
MKITDDMIRAGVRAISTTRYQHHLSEEERMRAILEAALAVAPNEAKGDTVYETVARRVARDEIDRVVAAMLDACSRSEQGDHRHNLFLERVLLTAQNELKR